ncbi:Putative 115 kDa protein in type-1 retrotransposable element R1DM [Eumeta japonica]|uniref:115 kDa protein in type-1 retrotransposable element R1DM n=1 Tax=Eumeta variegata TaxID=151549 RepID=A0A4C1V9I8_EUMVA|nr:Putative 115 kDa protein in type-1 retrotransposable element R1DM [Eumeta japonica]
MQVRRRIDGDDRPHVISGDLHGEDPPYIEAEVKNALKAFYLRKRVTEDALCDLMLYIYTELNLKNIILIVLLDIECTFDNIWWAALKTQLLAYKCPVNLYATVWGYLGDWEAFADDVVLMFSVQSASSVEEDSNRVLAHMHYWGVKNKLRFTPLKINSMMLTSKLKYDDPLVQINSEQISLVGEIRLLGLTIDRKLTFIPYVAKACKKAINIHKELVRAAKATWGLSLEVVRTIYIAVIEPIVLVRKVAWLYEVKRNKYMGDTFVDRELKRPVYFGDLPHPVHLREMGYDSVEDPNLEPSHRSWATNLYRQKPNRGQSRHDPYGIASRRGNLALNATTRSLLHGLSGRNGRALKSDTEGENRHDLPEIVTEDRAVCLFWAVDAGIAGNERANELVKQAVLAKKTEADYDRFPLSYAKKYLCRFKLRNSLYCVYDPAKIQNVLHVLDECGMFLRKRMALKTRIDVQNTQRHFPKIMENPIKREKFLKFCSVVIKVKKVGSSARSLSRLRRPVSRDGMVIVTVIDKAIAGTGGPKVVLRGAMRVICLKLDSHSNFRPVVAVFFDLRTQ